MISGWDAWVADQGERLPDGKAINVATTFVISLGAALAGAGMAMAHETVASDLLADGRLVRLNDHAVVMQEAYYLASPAKHAETPASQAFTHWLLAEIHC